MDDPSASVFCFTPLRVPVSELGRLAACPPSQPSSTAPVCSAPPLPEGPCPVCPRLDQDFEAFRQAAYWKAHARPSPRARGPAQSRDPTARGNGPSSRATTLWAQDRDRRGDGSGGPGCAPRRHAAASAARPATRSARSKATRLLPPSGRRRPSSPSAGEVPLLAVWSAVRRLPRHRGFHHPGGRGPGPSPGHSPPPLPPHLLVRRSSRHRHGPAAAPADSQEHPGGLDLGDDPLG